MASHRDQESNDEDSIHSDHRRVREHVKRRAQARCRSIHLWQQEKVDHVLNGGDDLTVREPCRSVRAGKQPHAVEEVIPKRLAGDGREVRAGGQEPYDRPERQRGSHSQPDRARDQGTAADEGDGTIESNGGHGGTRQ
jgi:hypothetical protein